MKYEQFGGKQPITISCGPAFTANISGTPAEFFMLVQQAWNLREIVRLLTPGVSERQFSIDDQKWIKETNAYFDRMFKDLGLKLQRARELFAPENCPDLVVPHVAFETEDAPKDDPEENEELEPDLVIGKRIAELADTDGQFCDALAVLSGHSSAMPERVAIIVVSQALDLVNQNSPTKVKLRPKRVERDGVFDDYSGPDNPHAPQAPKATTPCECAVCQSSQAVAPAPTPPPIQSVPEARGLFNEIVELSVAIRATEKPTGEDITFLLRLVSRFQEALNRVVATAIDR